MSLATQPIRRFTVWISFMTQTWVWHPTHPTHRFHVFLTSKPMICLRILRSSLRWSFHLSQLAWLTLGALYRNQTWLLLAKKTDQKLRKDNFVPFLLFLSFRKSNWCHWCQLTFCQWVRPKMAPHNLPPFPKRTVCRNLNMLRYQLWKNSCPGRICCSQTWVWAKSYQVGPRSPHLHTPHADDSCRQKIRSILLEVPRGQVPLLSKRTADLFLPAQHLTNFETKKLGSIGRHLLCSCIVALGLIYLPCFTRKFPCGLASLVSLKWVWR